MVRESFSSRYLNDRFGGGGFKRSTAKNENIPQQAVGHPALNRNAIMTTAINSRRLVRMGSEHYIYAELILQNHFELIEIYGTITGFHS